MGTRIQERGIFKRVGDIANLSPPLMCFFLKGLINSKLKQESVAQCIVKTVKQDTISPLLFGLRVDLDQTSGSKGLLRHLSRLGLSISPEEVTFYR